MEWVDDLRGSFVCVDTALFIYFIEENPRYLPHLHAQHVETLAVSSQIAEVAARLRAGHNLRTPDALQIATAIVSGATSFLTNDAQLAGPWIPGTLILDRL